MLSPLSHTSQCHSHPPLKNRSQTVYFFLLGLSCPLPVFPSYQLANLKLTPRPDKASRCGELFLIQIPPTIYLTLNVVRVYPLGPRTLSLSSVLPRGSPVGRSVLLGQGLQDCYVNTPIPKRSLSARRSPSRMPNADVLSADFTESPRALYCPSPRRG